jgi:hypothetical protein
MVRVLNPQPVGHGDKSHPGRVYSYRNQEKRSCSMDLYQVTKTIFCTFHLSVLWMMGCDCRTCGLIRTLSLPMLGPRTPNGSVGNGDGSGC